jgi:predicted lipid-binding transport protein (Tim44 family)
MMKKTNGIFLTLLFCVAILLGSWSDVEARRFGGARSFGGKSAFSSPYRRSTTPKRSVTQQKAYQQNQATRQAISRRGGFMRMLGGLAIGGLLGAIFFGGVFESLNFFDLLVFGGIAYLLLKLFAARSGTARRQSYGRAGYSDRQNTAGFDTDGLFNRDHKHQSNAQRQHFQDVDFEAIIVPEGFDEADFLAGAKGAFMTLQEAWDQHDLAEIRNLTTTQIYAEIQQQIQASDIENHTDVLTLNAELLDVREMGSELEVVVLFDYIMRENIKAHAEQVQEVWHFVKPKASTQPKWYLDGIQQLE